MMPKRVPHERVYKLLRNPCMGNSFGLVGPYKLFMYRTMMKAMKQKETTDFDFQLASLEWLNLQVKLYRQLKLKVANESGEQKVIAKWLLLEQYLLLEQELKRFKE